MNDVGICRRCEEECKKMKCESKLKSEHSKWPTAAPKFIDHDDKLVTSGKGEAEHKKGRKTLKKSRKTG